MRMQHPAVIEIDELMLSTATHSDDARAPNRSPLGRRDAAAKRRVMDLERRDATTLDERAELADGTLDLRQLRQARCSREWSNVRPSDDESHFVAVFNLLA